MPAIAARRHVRAARRHVRAGWWYELAGQRQALLTSLALALSFGSAVAGKKYRSQPGSFGSSNQMSGF